MIAGRVDGPLPALLVGLTVVTGLVDAFSYLSLGNVFVANMTGNVVFGGFAVAGVGEIRITSVVLAVLAFALGAIAGGRWAAGRGPHRGRLLAAATAGQAGLVLAAALVAHASRVRGAPAQLTLIAVLAAAMGGQNAVVRRLAVPDLTTTVLTLTVTGLVADTTRSRVRVRRLVSIVAMLGGALVGGVLLRFVGPSAPLWLAAALLGTCAAAAYAASRRPQSAAWR
jgi:uncharacterized membrane protein YoaK (UPF0700 family)